MTPNQQICVCRPSSPILQYSVSTLTLSGLCGSALSTTLQFPKAFVSKGLGTWTNPNVYPGVEELRWNTGGYRYADCTGVVQGEVFFGVTTIGGLQAFEMTSAGPGLPLPATFVDQGNSLTQGLATTMNGPYVTTHVLNLNLP
jgi:hypothetical protein